VVAGEDCVVGVESRAVTFTSLPGMTAGPLVGSWIVDRGDGGGSASGDARCWAAARSAADVLHT